MSVLDLPAQPKGENGSLVYFVRFFLAKDESGGTYWTLKVDKDCTAFDITRQVARNLGVSRGTFKLHTLERSTAADGNDKWTEGDDVHSGASMWDLVESIRSEGATNDLKLVLREKEGRKNVLSREITLSQEDMRIFDTKGVGEAFSTHTSEQKQRKKKKEEQLKSEDLGNWQPRVPRKSEKIYTKSFQTDVAKLRSKKKFNEKLTVFKAIHRDLQEETFVYKSQTDQNRGRQDLLDVGQFLLSSLDNCPAGDRNLFFGSILFIIKRQEFNVCDLQFDVGLKPQFSPATISTLLQYRKFLFECQIYIQRKLEQPGAYPALLSFCASILAINYFYIDGLDQLLLDRCWPESRKAEVNAAHPEIAEYAAFVQTADKEETIADTSSSNLFLGGENSSPSIAYFCMLKSLFSALRTAAKPDKRKEVEKYEVDSRQFDAPWQSHMVEGGDFFHIFLLEWLAQIAYFIGSYKKIRWGLIPGYYGWLSIVLLQMIEQPLNEWSEEFIQCTDSFLLNPKLLSVYVKITMKKTNIHMTEEVESTLRLIDGWIDLLPVSVDDGSGQIDALHPSFDYDFFISGIRMLLEQDHFVILLETLLLLYNHMDRFVGVHRVAMLDRFLLSPKIFLKLFLCWNHHVRHVYHLLLVYKLRRFRKQDADMALEAGHGGGISTLLRPENVIGEAPPSQDVLVSPFVHFGALTPKRQGPGNSHLSGPLGSVKSDKERSKNPLLASVHLNDSSTGSRRSRSGEDRERRHRSKDKEKEKRRDGPKGEKGDEGPEGKSVSDEDDDSDPMPPPATGGPASAAASSLSAGMGKIEIVDIDDDEPSVGTKKEANVVDIAPPPPSQPRPKPPPPSDSPSLKHEKKEKKRKEGKEKEGGTSDELRKSKRKDKDKDKLRESRRRHKDKDSRSSSRRSDSLNEMSTSSHSTKKSGSVDASQPSSKLAQSMRRESSRSKLRDSSSTARRRDYPRWGIHREINTMKLSVSARGRATSQAFLKAMT